MRKVLEGLIDGQFFCPYSNRDVYEQLRQPEYAAAIDGALRPIGRALARLGEGEDVTAFFARYVDLADSGDRREAMDADSTPSGHPVRSHLARHSTAIWPPV
ncbi:hypothetical protein QOT38_30275, partial [Pseudomonas aeruginosa]